MVTQLWYFLFLLSFYWIFIEFLLNFFQIFTLNLWYLCQYSIKTWLILQSDFVNHNCFKVDWTLIKDQLNVYSRLTRNRFNMHWIEYGSSLDLVFDQTLIRNYLNSEVPSVWIGSWILMRLRRWACCCFGGAVQFWGKLTILGTKVNQSREW